ncbi:MAG: polysaccharide biosynthesis C-terminal domain-containing protein [Bacilli bacterium]|nr:polysaccharide biosynthesis C-terminal domain-containing protein [Bacilli bacterium]
MKGFELGRHVSVKQLLLGAAPSVLMMISISVYGVFDGFFVSNFAGKTPFAALNLIYPVIMILGSLGFMMGSGGSALVAKCLGEGKQEEANKQFFNAVAGAIVLGIVSSLATYFVLPSLAIGLGADEAMLEDCVNYGRIMVLGVTAFNLQNLFQNFMVTAGKGRLGFRVTLLAGIVNIAFDAIFIVGCRMGVVGAAIGTVLGQVVGAVIPIIYFARSNSSTLRLAPCKPMWGTLGKMVGNGMSEFVNTISASGVSLVLNASLMQYFGEDGVGAYGIICYVWLVFAAVFIGYNVTIAPRVSYCLGAKDYRELRSLYVKSLWILLAFGLLQFALAEALAVPLSHAFGGYDESLLQLTIRASLIYGLTYLFLGVNMFGSAFFTALNNGVVSLLLSFFRLAVLEIGSVAILPRVFGGEAIWYAVPLAEALGLVMVVAVMQSFSKKYGYDKNFSLVKH